MSIVFPMGSTPFRMVSRPFPAHEFAYQGPGVTGAHYVPIGCIHKPYELPFVPNLIRYIPLEIAIETIGNTMDTIGHSIANHKNAIETLGNNT